MDEQATEQTPWPLRPILLAAVGVVAAVTVQQILEAHATDPIVWRVAVSAAISTAAMSFGFVAERVRLPWTIAFALIVGAVAGLVTWWSGGPGGSWADIWGWRGVSLLVAIAITAPLFQTARDQGSAHFPYPEVLGHVWINVILWFACWAFVGIAFALTFLLSELFQLIGLTLLKTLLLREWFAATLFGAAFGGALGIFRERDRIVRTLQRVVTAVLGVLAPVLGVGLAVFLLALPFTGLGALWAATRSATPTLLACVIGAVILANAVIGDGPEDEARNPVLRWGALALAAAMLPLAVIASIATGLRIGQYGFTPDRLWALVFVAVAVAYGVAYWVAIARGRLNWAEKVRPANLNLAFGLAGLALFLALPIVSFNAISTRDQVARLQSGKVTPEKFDWAALAFDYGAPGKAALAKLRSSPDPLLRRRAVQAGTAATRWDLVQAVPSRDEAAKSIRVLPAGSPPLPDALLDTLGRSGCGGNDQGGCTVLVTAPGKVIVVRQSCFGGTFPLVCENVQALSLADGQWSIGREVLGRGEPGYAERAAAQQKAYAAGQVEVRPVQRRQVYVGGVPVGDPFE
ncbi:hypothetical protein BH09PSE4_BH09PSE4_11930 [soil metagenome]